MSLGAHGIFHELADEHRQSTLLVKKMKRIHASTLTVLTVLLMSVSKCGLTKALNIWQLV